MGKDAKNKVEQNVLKIVKQSKNKKNYRQFFTLSS